MAFPILLAVGMAVAFALPMLVLTWIAKAKLENGYPQSRWGQVRNPAFQGG